MSIEKRNSYNKNLNYSMDNKFIKDEYNRISKFYGTTSFFILSSFKTVMAIQRHFLLTSMNSEFLVL